MTGRARSVGATLRATVHRACIGRPGYGLRGPRREEWIALLIDDRPAA
ncbi:hypothetical protein BSLA_01r3468 [Burkholderia stabilis]|nr:hypothetical protein BSLA_01r3468 [Burkholderia stabilis]